MNPHPVHRLPPPLESAVQRLKLAARAAAERTVESLGLAALASNSVHERDNLLGAQFELNRKSAIFVLTFNEQFDQRVLREVGTQVGDAGAVGWGALSLVEDHAIEIQVAAERFGMDVAHACEWELRELGGYIGPLLLSAASGRADIKEGNPLRPEVVGHAMIHAIEAVSDRADVRKVLNTELGRSMGSLLRGTYADIVAELRQAGMQPAGLTVRSSGESRGAAAAGVSAAAGQGAAPLDAPATQGRAPRLDDERHSVAGSVDSRYGRRSAPGAFGTSTRSGNRNTLLGHVDPALMSVIRRLAFNDGGNGGAGGDGGSGWADAAEAGAAGAASNAGSWGTAPLPNLIRAHRDELRQASNGSLDHMVIDVIGSLFEQILADPKVPPQMARQIARLQLPVLRAALGDPTFFSSRRHPVRRFVNRIASLGAAFEDFGDVGAQQVLAKVRELVKEVVEGDFDQIGVYEQKLQALESFVAEQGRIEVDAGGAAAAELLSAKEDELRLRALYAQQLQGELKGLSAPVFVRDFISHIWSQVLIQAGTQGGSADERAAREKRLRHVGRELFMSVQPKTSPAQRKAFLADLPRLMKELGDGMDLIRWPESARRTFFGQLLPAHAESLKAQAQRPLDFNMLARQVDGALERPLPSGADLKITPTALPVLNDEIVAPRFSSDEARRIGLVEEAAVDWNGTVDIDLSAEPELAVGDDRIAGLPAPAEPMEPVQGRSLADHVQIGFAYQMHLDGGWQKVRLAHVSAGRNFFVFHHGGRHKKTVSLSQRMLARMCETGRLRAFESAYLLERATARARRQLASVNPG